MAILRFDRQNYEVPTEYRDDEGILNCLFRSILDVDKGYIYYHKNVNGPEYPQTERVFAYEFYRKWSNNVERDLHDYIVNGEPEKNVSKFRNVQYQYPDLVLHYNQGNNSKQGIVCEIKRKKGFTSSNFKDDIEKLYHFACNPKCKYRFQFGAFILVGAKMDAIINAILNTNKELLTFNRNNKRLNNIVCITYNGVEMELCQLRELVDMSREQMRRIIVEYNNQR